MRVFVCVRVQGVEGPPGSKRHQNHGAPGRESPGERPACGQFPRQTGASAKVALRRGQVSVWVCFTPGPNNFFDNLHTTFEKKTARITK